MSNLNECAKQVPQETPALIRALSVQDDHNKEMESLYDSINALINRAENIGDRLCPRQPADECLGKSSCGPSIPTNPGGVLGVIVSINQRSEEKISILANSLIPRLTGAIYYIEQHV